MFLVKCNLCLCDFCVCGFYKILLRVLRLFFWFMFIMRCVFVWVCDMFVGVVCFLAVAIDCAFAVGFCVFCVVFVYCL